jgi:hypothetical protein
MTIARNWDTLRACFGLRAGFLRLLIDQHICGPEQGPRVENWERRVVCGFRYCLGQTIAAADSYPTSTIFLCIPAAGI